MGEGVTLQDYLRILIEHALESTDEYDLKYDDTIRDDQGFDEFLCQYSSRLIYDVLVTNLYLTLCVRRKC